MESVVFENMAAVKTFKKEKRQEMLVLMMKFPEWYKHPDTPIGKTIVQLGKLIDGETMDVSRPIQTINKETFTKEDYVKLKQLGYSEKAIRRAAKIPGNSWWSYRANLLANESSPNEKKQRTHVYS